MRLGFTLEGAIAAYLSKIAKLPVEVVYRWDNPQREATVRGVVSGPVRPFASSSRRITKSTELVHLTGARVTEEGHGRSRIVPRSTDWAVHTDMVKLHIGSKAS